MASKKPIYPGATTGRGAVLAVLLSNDDQAGAEPLQGRVTLAAIVKSLKRKYHWPVETHSFPANSPDGRATWATVYSLPEKVIATALKGEGGRWMADRAMVRRARVDALNARPAPRPGIRPEWREGDSAAEED
jgi:hypothetical protein